MNLVSRAIGDKSVTKFAEEADIHRSYLSKLKNGSLEFDPKPEILEKIAENIPEILNSSQHKGENINIKEGTVDSKNPISSFAYYTVAMLSMFILFISSYGGKFILDEKRNNTFQRQIASGKSLELILVGKFFMMFVMVVSINFPAYSYMNWDHRPHRKKPDRW